MKTQYLSRQEVADYLGVHPLTIYSLIKKGEIPASKVGNVYRINKDDVQKYLKRTKEV